jgi:hypothetical protein
MRSYETHKYTVGRMQSYWLLTQVVHIVTTGFQRVNVLHSPVTSSFFGPYSFFSLIIYALPLEKHPSFTPVWSHYICITRSFHVLPLKIAQKVMRSNVKWMHVFERLGNPSPNEAHDVTNANISAWVAYTSTHVSTVTKPIRWDDATLTYSSRERSLNGASNRVTLLVSQC